MLSRALVLLVFGALASVLNGQVVSLNEVVADTTVNYRFELRDGSVLLGTAVAVDSGAITLRTRQMGDVTVQKATIEQVVRMDASTMVRGQYWFPNPHDTRHLIGPSAIPLRRGEGYYQNTYLLLNSLAVGLTDHFSISGGFELISTFSPNGGGPIFFITAKGSAPVAKKLHLGAAGAYLSIPNWFASRDERQRTAVGALTGLATYGTRDAQVTCGVGWSHNGEDFSQRPIFTISTLLRMSRKTAFVSENWIVPQGQGHYGIFSYGLRFMGEKIAVDLAFINNSDIMEGIVIGIPFIDFAVKF